MLAPSPEKSPSSQFSFSLSVRWATIEWMQSWLGCCVYIQAFVSQLTHSVRNAHGHSIWENCYLTGHGIFWGWILTFLSELNVRGLTRHARKSQENKIMKSSLKFEHSKTIFIFMHLAAWLIWNEPEASKYFPPTSPRCNSHQRSQGNLLSPFQLFRYQFCENWHQPYSHDVLFFWDRCVSPLTHPCTKRTPVKTRNAAISPTLNYHIVDFVSIRSAYAWSILM